MDMGDLQAELDRFNGKLNEWLSDMKVYFSQLNEQEMYGWIGEGVGFIVLIVGLVLLAL